MGLLINLGFYGELFVATLYFQQIRGYTALGTGLAMAPQMGMLAVASTLSGRVMACTGPRLPMIAGLALGGAGLLGLLVAGADTRYVLLVAPLAAAGFGIAFPCPPRPPRSWARYPTSAAGSPLASSTPPARSAGSSHPILGALVARRATFLPGLHAAVIIGGAAFLLGCGLTIAAVGRRRGRT